MATTDPAPPPPWRLRIAAFVTVVVGLCTLSFAAGAHGTFTSAEHRLDAEMLDPDHRVQAGRELADRLAHAVAGDKPVVAGDTQDGSCPGAYAETATTVIGSLTDAEARITVRAIGQRLRGAGWSPAVATARGLGAGVAATAATNGSGVQIEADEVRSSITAAVQVTVVVPCGPGPAAPHASTTAPAG